MNENGERLEGTPSERFCSNRSSLARRPSAGSLAERSAVKTPQADSMGQIAAQVSTVLKPLGFRKRQHTFNRLTADSLIHVINLQMGRYEIGKPKEIPGFRENLYGKFTVNLGVFVPELHREKLGREPASFVNEPECAIRARFSDLLKSNGDLWWPLGEDDERVADEIIRLLIAHGIPFLTRFSTRYAIIQQWPVLCEEMKLSPRPLLDVALIAHHLGRKEDAQAAFGRHMSLEHHPLHKKYCEELAKRNGWTDGQPAAGGNAG